MECWWFFWPMRAKCSGSEPCSRMCSRPAAPNIHGAGGRPTSEIWASSSPWRAIGGSRSVNVAPSEPRCIFSKPSASVQSARPPRMACAARYSALEPVEQLEFTLNTGMPVIPSSYTARCPEHDSPYT